MPTTPAELVRPECQVGEHTWCKPGDVVTCYGDVALTIRCDCSCHPKAVQR